MFTIFIFLSSGLFLGWSLGANDAANIFGTAVGTKMIKFRTAAIIGSIFVILGAVISGAGASHTLGKLGAVNALPGSFIVAFSAALTVYWMTRLKLPVSTSQAIVGAIIGWNIFAGKQTDMSSLTKIVSTWIICPLLSALFSVLLYYLIKLILRKTSIHMIRMDALTRFALIMTGAFGAYSLGANNIANVMGVFIPVAPFSAIKLTESLSLSGVQILFLLGGLAISVGIITYSKRVMMTVGNSIFKLSPITAFIVVISSSLVLFLFASQGLQTWLIAHNLPSLPLVPVSSSQAVVGAVLGIGIAKSGRNIHFKTIGRIGFGWISTPIAAGLLAFVLLFVMQNLFMQTVYL
jgi:inorganic phosphate transporter, PiT family